MPTERITTNPVREIASRFAPPISRRDLITGGAVAAVAVLASSITEAPAAELDAPESEAVQQVREHLTEALRLHRERKAAEAAFQVKFHALIKTHKADAYALEEEHNDRFPVGDVFAKAIAVKVSTPADLMAKLALIHGFAAATSRDFLDWYAEEQSADDIRATIQPAPFPNS